ncbi:MAG: hypothetical protein U0892_04240 [Pirellulales bacterium]
MNDYLSRLVDKHHDGQDSVMQPRIASRYEQPQNLLSSGGDEDPVLGSSMASGMTTARDSAAPSPIDFHRESLERMADDSRHSATLRTESDRETLDRLSQAERMLRNLQPGKKAEFERSTLDGSSMVPPAVFEAAPPRASTSDLHQHFHIHDDRVTNIQQGMEPDRRTDVPQIALPEQAALRNLRDTGSLTDSSGVGRNSVPQFSLPVERTDSDRELRKTAVPTLTADNTSSVGDAGPTIQVSIGRIEIRSLHKGSRRETSGSIQLSKSAIGIQNHDAR